MKHAVKLLSVAVVLSLGAMAPVSAADPIAAFAASVPDTLSAMASRAGFSEAMADLQRHAFAVGYSNGFNAPSMPRRDRVVVPSAPKHRRWLTLLAGIGLIGVLIGRAKRRYA